MLALTIGQTRMTSGQRLVLIAGVSKYIKGLMFDVLAFNIIARGTST